MKVLAFSPVGSTAEVKAHNHTDLRNCWNQNSDPAWVLRLLQLGTWSCGAPGSFWSILPRHSLDPLEQKACTYGIFWSMGARDLDAQCYLIFRKWRSGCMVLFLRVFLKAVLNLVYNVTTRLALILYLFLYYLTSAIFVYNFYNFHNFL